MRARASEISAKSLVPVCICAVAGAEADDEPAGAALCGNNGHECNAPPIFTPAAGLHHSTDKMLHRLLLVWPSFHKQLARRYFHMHTYSSSRCFTFCLCTVSVPVRERRASALLAKALALDWLLLSAAANYNKSDACGEKRTPSHATPTKRDNCELNTFGINTQVKKYILKSNVAAKNCQPLKSSSDFCTVKNWQEKRLKWWPMLIVALVIKIKNQNIA